MGRKVLAPWGNNRPMPGNIAKVGHGRRGTARSHPSLNGMSYPANKPALWPIEGKLRASPTAPSEDYATRYNEILNNAYTRAGYAG